MLSNNKRGGNFTEGKILAPLMSFAFPVLLALFLQTMYGAVDLMVVGIFGDASDISAVSTGSWIMQTITSAVVGLAVGSTVMIAGKIGEGNPQDAGKVVGTSIFIFAAAGLLISILMQIAAEPFAAVLHAPKEAFDGTVLYQRICSGGAVFIVAYNVLGSVFRGIGNSRLPLVTVAIACVCNIAGDLLLVGVLRMGAAGAAIATVASQALSVFLSLIIIRRMSLPFTFTRDCLRFDGKTALKLIKIGFPIALQDVLVSISFLAINAIVNTLGVVTSAGVGIAEKICGFIMLVPSSYSQSISAFVAQNIGANKPDRAKKALVSGILTSLAVGVFIAYFSFFHGDLLAGIFNKEPEVVAMASEYLKAYAIDCIFVSFLFCFIGYFNGCSKTRFVMLQGIIGAFGVRIPVSYLMSKAVPVSVFRIGLATPCSTVVQIILCFAFYAVCNIKSRRQS